MKQVKSHKIVDGPRTSSAEAKAIMEGIPSLNGLFTRTTDMRVKAKEMGGKVSAVNEGDEIILSTDKGSIMRCAVKEIRVAGRNTQGVRIKKLSGTEKVVSVIKIEDNIK